MSNQLPSPAVTEALALLAEIVQWKSDDNSGYDTAIHAIHASEESLRALVDEIQQVREDRDIQDEIQRSVLAALKTLLAECGGSDDVRIAAEAAIALAEGRQGPA